MAAARELAEWIASLRYEDIPSSVLDRARLQVASVAAAVIAGSRLPSHAMVRRGAAHWGSADDATILPTGERVPVHTAAYVNATASVALDYDDYLFAGHTGHSAVVGSLALAEATGADGRAMVTAQVAANEVAGRLGASFLLGPHNGQMWAYVHALAGAAVGGRFLGPDADAIEHGICIALAQPPWPLSAGFFGPDSKMLLAAGPLVDGLRAASLASEGLTGGPDVIEEMLEKVAARGLPFVASGLGSSWVTGSLAYKVMPGCAYVDTPVEAMQDVMRAFAEKHGRALTPGDVAKIRVECTLLTAGMEAMSGIKDITRIRAVDVNFSARLSIGLLVAAGEVSARALMPDSIERRHEDIATVAGATEVEPTDEMNLRMSGLAGIGIDTVKLFDPSYVPTLVDADFSRFEMSFPARVTLLTTDREEYVGEADIPRGAPGRPFAETVSLVTQKFTREADGVVVDPARALDLLMGDEPADPVRLVKELCARGDR